MQLKWWDASQVPSVELLPSTPLALDDFLGEPGSPDMIVQVTTFECGGISVAVKMAHPLADAQALAHFMHDGAAVSRATLNETPMPLLSPVFDPQLLDRAAAGDIDAVRPDSTVVDMARSLPCHRFDWWASADGCPFETPATKIPPELDPAFIGPPGTILPWSDWDTDAPVSHYLIHFSGPEVTRIWEAASSPSAQVSHHDAFVAHVWALINRARAFEHDNDAVHLNVSFGLRTRLRPALPDSFLGSPIMNADALCTGREASIDSAASVAGVIRSTVAKFTPEALAAMLHDAAFEVTPRRLWQAFLGRRHVIVTSWVHQHLYEVDFGTGSLPRYVEAVMPSCDGIVEIMEAAPTGADAGVQHDSKKQKHWSDDGVDVSVCLEQEAMKRLVQDPLLRKYSA